MKLTLLILIPAVLVAAYLGIIPHGSKEAAPPKKSVSRAQVAPAASPRPATPEKAVDAKAPVSRNAAPKPAAPRKTARDLEREKKVQDLVAKLKGNDERAAYDAALKLAMFGDETAVEPLLEVARRESGMMRVAALKALGSIGDKRACPVLIAALRDKDVSARRNAASGLGRMKDESAIAPLIEALGDQDDWVRMDAQDSLKKITGLDLRDQEAWKKWYQER